MHTQLFDVKQMENRRWITPDKKIVHFLESKLFVCENPRYDDNLQGYYEIWVSRWNKNTKVDLIHVYFEPGLQGDGDNPVMEETLIRHRKAPNEDIKTLCEFVQELIEVAKERTAILSDN